MRRSLTCSSTTRTSSSTSMHPSKLRWTVSGRLPKSSSRSPSAASTPTLPRPTSWRFRYPRDRRTARGTSLRARLRTSRSPCMISFKSRSSASACPYQRLFRRLVHLPSRRSVLLSAFSRLRPSASPSPVPKSRSLRSLGRRLHSISSTATVSCTSATRLGPCRVAPAKNGSSFRSSTKRARPGGSCLGTSSTRPTSSSTCTAPASSGTLPKASSSQPTSNGASSSASSANRVPSRSRVSRRKRRSCLRDSS